MGWCGADLLKPRQSKALRSLGATVPFELEQMGGGCFYTERLSMFSLLYSKGYKDLGMETDWKPDVFTIGSARLAVSDGFCEMLASLSVAIVEQHCRRNLVFTHGLPRRQTLLLDPIQGQRFIDELKLDLAIHQKILDMDFDGQESYVKRSVFGLPAVQQLVQCLQLEGWEITPRTRAFLCLVVVVVAMLACRAFSPPAA
jgi:hypothetical protein